MLHIDVITLFPEMVEGVAAYGVLSRALKARRLALQCHNPRDYTNNRHGTVDDRPYGGGPGMVMCYQPLFDAIAAARQDLRHARVVHLSPQGRPLDQTEVERLYAHRELILVCGRYEGIDERLLDAVVDEDLSIGDFVVSGGELPALLLIEALVRCIPGALGNPASLVEDSYQSRVGFDWPHYTRPRTIDGRAAPSILCSGNHQAIRQWRLEQALRRTQSRRPDLIDNARLSVEEQTLLAQMWDDWGSPSKTSDTE